MDASLQIEKFKEFFETHYEKDIAIIVQKGLKSLIVDFSLLSQFDVELAEELLEDPEELIRAAELALTQFDVIEKSYLDRVRFSNLPASQYMKISDVRSRDLGAFLEIEGIVRQASDVRPQVTSARFECVGCGNTISILQIDSKFKEPTRCTCGMRGRFKQLSQELVDAQHLKIEEAPDSLDGGEQPKRLSVFLKEDLVEPRMEKKCSPGSKVRVTGIVKEVPVMLKTGAKSVRFDLILEANNIESAVEDFSDIEISNEEVEEIKAFARKPKVFERFAKSIAPSIYGHDKIKEALVLQMFGGIRRVKPDGTTRRGDIHILLCGDPGAGKSQLISFIAKAAPKARYVSGHGASGAGLTAAVVKDEFLRGWALEAGTMALAHKGIAVVDELDKMSHEDRSALHSALEQQIITIAKANIQATLNSQTTLLAAANPKLGRFDPYTPIAGQINLPPSLLNRFDLIFPVRDLPNKENDERIASHVLESTIDDSLFDTEVRVDFMKKYVSYTKQRIHPRLTKGAINEIKDFYVKLRNSGSSSDDKGVKPIPISARQLEGLMRLAEASAKVRLDEKVRREDALRAIELLRSCLMDVGFDPETGMIDIDRMTSSITASVRGKIGLVKEIINEFESKGMKIIPVEEIIASAALKGLDESSVEETIEKLKRSGDLFEPKKGHISKI
ncbi:minichromosome maintenance protein MCM [Candidatus Woesearchaeota archaeon]|nr:minichromosome maintenance protein MCM [Candidatus Woesearchaeota archaeon]